MEARHTSGSLSTFTRLQKLLHVNPASGVADIKATQFVNLCQAYGFEGITTQWLSRTLKSKKLYDDTDRLLEPLITKIEDLIKRAHLFPVSFENPDAIKFLLDVIGMGLDVSAGVIQRETNSSNQQSR